MARVSIYVSDGQKAEMDKLEDEANWSSVAQRAFEQEINRLKWPKETKMDQVIARLRQSKEDFDKAQVQFGVKDGREWAMNKASYSQLKDLAELDTSPWHSGSDDPGTLWEWVNIQLGQTPHADDCLFYDENAKRGEPDEYVEAFIDGAQQVWSEVQDKL